MSAAGIHAASDIVTFLISGWDNANTDNRTPEILNALEVPWQDLDFGVADILYVKNLVDAVSTGMYALEFYHRPLCTIEVMGAKLSGLAHFTKVVDEATRVIKANARLAGYALTVLGTSTPKYIKDRGIYSCTIEVKQLKVKTS